MNKFPVTFSLDKITKVELSYNDVTVWQDGSFVILDKDEVLKIAEMIRGEKTRDGL